MRRIIFAALWITFVALCVSLYERPADSQSWPLPPQGTYTTGPFAAGNIGGHLLPAPLVSGAQPSITSGCSGAGSGLSQNATDVNGTVTGSTAASTTCTVTFATAYTVAPDCAAVGISSALLTVTVSTTTIVETHASTANYKFSYICFGK